MVNIAKFAEPAIKCLNEDPFFNVDLPGGVGPVFTGALQGALGPFGPLVKLIPPTPDIITDITKLTKPTGVIELIADAFAAEGLPSVAFTFGGVEINIGKEIIPGFKPDGLINLLKGLIKIPLDLVVGMATGMLELDPPKPPSIDEIIKLALAAFEKDFDISEEGPIFKFVECFSTALLGVIKAVFP